MQFFQADFQRWRGVRATISLDLGLKIVLYKCYKIIKILRRNSVAT